MQPPISTVKKGLLIADNSSISDEQLDQIIFRDKSIDDNYLLEKDYFARGKFANVRRIKSREHGKIFAAKTIKKRRPRTGDVTDEIKHEIRVLLISEQCQRIVKLYEVYETKFDFTLVLELAEGGELQKLLDEEEFINESDCKRLMKQIIEGVQFLHQKNIAHLDIKPQNILLTKSLSDGGQVKLCDFGISRLLLEQNEIREIMGTIDYMPPEIIHYEPISLAADMWSLGIVCYVLLSGHSPFGDDDKNRTYSNITSGDLEFPDKLFNKISEDAKDFIRKLLIKDPKKRMDCDQCLKHRWLDNNLNNNDNKNEIINEIEYSNIDNNFNGLQNKICSPSNDQIQDINKNDINNVDEHVLVDPVNMIDAIDDTNLERDAKDLTIKDIDIIDDDTLEKSIKLTSNNSTVSSLTLSSIALSSSSTSSTTSSGSTSSDEEDISTNNHRDSGLGGNLLLSMYCDTNILESKQTHEKADEEPENGDEIKIALFNQMKIENQNMEDKENLVSNTNTSKETLLIPITIENQTPIHHHRHHKRLLSDIFPDRKLIADIVPKTCKCALANSNSNISNFNNDLIFCAYCSLSTKIIRKLCI